MTTELERRGTARRADRSRDRPGTILDDLEAGRLRAAEPDPTAPGRLAGPARRQGRDPRLLRGPDDASTGRSGRSTFRDRAGRAAARRPGRRAVADRARRDRRPARRPPRGRASS